MPTGGIAKLCRMRRCYHAQTVGVSWRRSSTGTTISPGRCASGSRAHFQERKDRIADRGRGRTLDRQFPRDASYALCAGRALHDAHPQQQHPLGRRGQRQARTQRPDRVRRDGRSRDELAGHAGGSLARLALAMARALDVTERWHRRPGSGRTRGCLEVPRAGRGAAAAWLFRCGCREDHRRQHSSRPHAGRAGGGEAAEAAGTLRRNARSAGAGVTAPRADAYFRSLLRSWRSSDCKSPFSLGYQNSRWQVSHA